MGAFQSKNRSGPQSPHINSPRHSSISGRVRIDSPKIGSSRSLRSVGSHGSLRNSVGKAAAAAKAAATEQTPLVATANGKRLLEEAAIAVSPPLAVWIGPALCCALAYALYNIFIKKGSASINPILGGVILQFVAAILGCCLLSAVVLYETQFKAEEPINLADDTVLDEDVPLLMWDWVGVKWAILAGFAVGAAEIISFCVSGMGVQAMQSIPIIIGGSVMFGTVLGYLALGETLTVRGWSGVVMISIGISLVGMDDQGEGV